MKKYEVFATNGLMHIEADVVMEDHGKLVFGLAGGDLVAIFAPGHWLYFQSEKEQPKDPTTALKVAA